jgi:hypothetical protein
MSISSRKQLLEEAGKVLKMIREVDEGLDKKVKTALKKIETAIEEKGDKTQALIELAKLIGEKKCVTKLEAIKEIEKVEEGTPYFIDQYRKEVEKFLLDTAKEKFDSDEYGAVISAVE